MLNIQLEQVLPSQIEHRSFELIQQELDHSVCVGAICDKAGISQSTVSHYLDMLQRAGLLESRRYGKWTYYRRNEENIRKLADYIATRI